MLRSLLLLFVPIASFAQFTYKLDQSIPVEIGGRTLAMPWAGGLNSAQVNTIDFDGDGNEDIVIFDHTVGKIMPYRNAGGKYEYTPDYEVLFPESVNSWMLLRDFNCDGKKDLFTSDPFGIIVFVNTTKPGQSLSWRAFNPGFPLLTKGFNGNINLKINNVDVPAIDDVDGDGDLDILAMRFVGIGTIEFHKNMSIENSGKCDSLQLERVTQVYGGMEECSCGVFAFGQTCDELINGRVEHVGGKALLNIDADNDGDMDLLFVEESCNQLFIMQNKGDKNNALFDEASYFTQANPAKIRNFPAPYFEDVDFDGLKDIVVSPNVNARTNEIFRTKNSLWFYKNTGTEQLPVFTLVKENFLQEDIIDVGDYSAPALLDVDNDGDEDLFVGFFVNDSVRSSMYHFENIGSASDPKFRLITTDYGGLSQFLLYNIKPQAVDANGDGKIDLAFTASKLQSDGTSLYYIPNTADAGFTPDIRGTIETELTTLGVFENVYLTDVNRDGTPDVLIGKTTGALAYYENGTNDGTFSALTLKNEAYLGVGTSTSRQSPSVATADLDADGAEDMVVGDQRGNLSFYVDYRNFDSNVSQPSSQAIFNKIVEDYNAMKFGGRMRMAISNLFNSSKPAIVIGNTLGGLYVLRNDDSNLLPDQPEVRVGPNPLPRGDDLQIRSDRNTKVQIFSILGQKMSEQIVVPANQTFPLPLKELAAGMYIARFTFPKTHVAIKFIIK